MKKHLMFGMLFATVISLCGCGKGSSGGGGGGTPPPATEEKLAAKLSAAAIETSPSSSFTFTADIQSKIPSGGVTIKVDAKREDTNASVYSVQANSSVASNSFTVSPLPPGQVYCTVTVTITSVATPSNSWVGSFRVLWK